MRSHNHHGIAWHDLPRVDEGDLRELQRKYGFHELDIEDCLSEHERPKIEEYDTYLFLVFHIPYLNRKTNRIMKEEANIFLGQDFIVTLHEGRLPILDALCGHLKESPAKCQEYMGQGTGFFLYKLMEDFFDGVFPLVDNISRKLREIEEALFESEEEADLLHDIIMLKRNIITLRSILHPQRTLIANLEHKDRKFIAEELTIYFDDVLDAIERQWSVLETSKEMIDAFHETHKSWLAHRTNAVIRILTVFSIVVLPLIGLTSFYGMNVQLPYAEGPYAFLSIIGLILLMMFGLIVYFWRKDWL